MVARFFSFPPQTRGTLGRSYQVPAIQTTDLSQDVRHFEEGWDISTLERSAFSF